MKHFSEKTSLKMRKEQVGSELCQAQVKLEVIHEVGMVGGWVD